MEVQQGHLYDFPTYYDLVFGSDWKAEYDFLLGCFERYGRRVNRVFEPACGTGRLLYRLAQAGFDSCGIDLNSKAVDYCNARLRRHRLPETAVVADMTAYRLKPKADAAFNMINSFRHLVEEEQAAEHLHCVADSLRKNGLYVLGLHLTPTRGIPTDEESWTARRGHLGVTTRLWTIDRDLKRRAERFRMHYDVYTPSRSFRIEDEITFRTYTLEQITSLIDTVGRFDIAETFDFAYNLQSPIELTDETEDVVFVLRRR